jgi:hypothetical protein
VYWKLVHKLGYSERWYLCIHLYHYCFTLMNHFWTRDPSLWTWNRLPYKEK